MRIAVRRNNPERLDLLFRPVLAPAYWGAGVLFAVLGFVVIWLLARSLSLDCDRPRKTCEVTEWHVLRRVREDIPVRAVRGARVVTWTRGVSAGMTLVVETDVGDRPLRLVKSNGIAKESMAWDIWHFATDTTVARLQIADDARPAGWLLGLVLIAGGVVCVLALERVNLSIDRAAGKVVIVRRRWFDSGVTTLALDEVKDAELKEFHVRQASSYAVVLRLAEGREEALTRLPLFTRSSANHAVGLIGSWLEGRVA